MKTLADAIKHLEAIESKHPKLNKGNKGISIEQDAQPLWESIWRAVEKFTGSCTSNRFKDILYKAVGDAIAYKSRHRRKTVSLKDMERTQEILKKKGISV